jgi:excisionase family DNA binding protein
VDDEQLALSATALANRLGISRAHVWKLLSLGRLPAPVRLGRAVRWDKRVVDAWLAAGAPPLSQWERIKQAEKVR